MGGPSARQALLSLQLTISVALLGIQCTALDIYDVPGSALGAREAIVTWICSAVMELTVKGTLPCGGARDGWAPKVLWAQRSSASLEGTSCVGS